jgi:hypothetical protein
MRLRVGQTLTSVVDGTALVVVRCPDADVSVTCGGRDMTTEAAPLAAGAADAGGVAEPGDGGLELGKRYAAEDVGLELLCTRPGTHPVAVGGAPVLRKSAKPLPASD